MLHPEIKELLFQGTVIPAHPLALNGDRSLDREHQRLLTRYYMASGAGGIAVGVHTTQFQIRDPKIDLYHKVLQLASEEVSKGNLERPFIKVAGISGDVEQAVNEAGIAAGLGYDLVLVSNNGLGDWSEKALLDRTREVAKIMPVFGFYLQPAVGGKILSHDFWKQFAEIKNVQAIKMAPFNRYQTLEVVRAVCGSSRCNDIALYTGNDDNIMADLLTTYKVKVNDKVVEKDVVGGLLGHWAVWTYKAVQIFEEIKKVKRSGTSVPKELLTLGMAITDANAAFFDAANDFHGCIPGIHEVLRRQNMVKGIWCLDPRETLSPTQKEEIDRVYRDYPELNDDQFVADNMDKWLLMK